MRVAVAEEVITYRRLLEQVFAVDLLLSTQLLTTTRVLNEIHGHATMAVEYLAAGKVQLRKIHLDADSPLVKQPLRDVLLPRNSLVAAFYRGDDLIIPGGDDQAQEGDDALILGTSDVIEQAELAVSNHRKVIGKVVIAGRWRNRQLGRQGPRSFGDSRQDHRDREESSPSDSRRSFPQFEIIYGDATDLALLKAERIGLAKSFVGLTANDESNLMACLLAQELGVEQVLAMVHRSETTQLWKRLGMQEVFSPRTLARERIEEYIESGYSSNIVSLHKGAAQVLERKLAEASPASGVTLAEMNPPRGMIVGAVKRGEDVFVPDGNDRLQTGDLVILFVHESELDTVRLLFPGRERS